MQDFSSRRSLIQNVARPARLQHLLRRAVASPLLLGLLIVLPSGRTQAATPDTAPAALTDTLSQIDAAANRHDVRAVMEFYDRNLTHSDGLTYDSLQQALTALWQRYPNLTYRTELTSWEAQSGGFVAETTTTITGTGALSNREVALTSTIGSRQRFEGQAIVQQDILTERSQLTAGEKPPTVEVNLPQTIAIGRDYGFDAIVQEPTANRLLLGAAIEEPVNANAYLNPAALNLELLTAGGLFKIGRAPALPDDRWLSAIIIREDGITAVTQRLQVTTQANPR